MKEFLKIHQNDNVAVRLKDGHKIALRDIKKGEAIIKYGFPIGTSTQDIKESDWVHTHNIKTNLAEDAEYTYKKEKPHAVSYSVEQTFSGYVRSNGDIGIRNEIWIIPTVGCVNQIVKNLEKMAADKYYKSDSYDGAYSFTHPYGCSQMGEDQENTRKILAGLATNPNGGGVLIIGLGCENSNIEILKGYLGHYDSKRIKFLVCQAVSDEYAEGMKLIGELYDEMQSDRRETVSISKLKVGLKCGGSDGYSGITANPLVGRFSDMLVANGGTVVLTEVPEMFGAETLLMNRAKDKRIFEKIVDMIHHFKNYFISHNQIIYDNPSPGNKEGGISTLEEKSLGCIQKGGSSEIIDILNYGEKIRKNGLHLLYGPGNDIVSTTAMAASGCQLLLFTTGRGTPLGTSVPTFKIAANSKIFNMKTNWFDFNAGTMLEDTNIDKISGQLFNDVLEVVNGKNTAGEIIGFREIAIFKDGVTL